MISNAKGFLQDSSLGPILLACKEKVRGLKGGDFSQFGEQVLISKLIPSTPGSYLDIGSGRPVSGSNTYRLYKIGWSGILVDPIRTNFLLSKTVRPRDKSFNSLVGPGGSTSFYEFFPYEYSTASKIEADKLAAKSPSVAKLLRTYKIDSVPASYFFKMLPKKDFVFLNVDVEGFDLQVLESLDLRENRPDLICVEEWEFLEAKPGPIRKFLANSGYVFVSRLGVSSFYKRT